MWQKFTSSSKRAIKTAHEEAKHYHWTVVEPEHILMGILKDRLSFAIKLLEKMGADPGTLQSELEGMMQEGTFEAEDLHFSRLSKKVLESAYTEARQLHHTFIGSEHLLLAILQVDESKAFDFLAHHDVTYESARENLKGMIQHLPEEDTEEKYTADQPSEGLTISLESDVLLKKAFGEARLLGEKTIRPEHILMALLKLPELDATKFLQERGITIDQIQEWLESRGDENDKPGQ